MVVFEEGTSDADGKYFAHFSTFCSEFFQSYMSQTKVHIMYTVMTKVVYYGKSHRILVKWNLF